MWLTPLADELHELKSFAYEIKAHLERLENATALLQREAVRSDDEGAAEVSAEVEEHEEDYIDEDQLIQGLCNQSRVFQLLYLYAHEHESVFAAAPYMDFYEHLP